MARLVVLLLWSAGGMLYVFFDVFLHRSLDVIAETSKPKTLKALNLQVTPSLEPGFGFGAFVVLFGSGCSAVAGSLEGATI